MIIREIEYKMHYSLRGLVVYETLKGETFMPGKLLDEITLYYSILIASNPDATLTFQEFFDALDEDSNMLISLRKWLDDEVSLLSIASNTDDKKKG